MHLGPFDATRSPSLRLGPVHLVRAIAIVAVVVALASVTEDASSARPHRKCAVPGARVVAANSRGRILVVRTAPSPAGMSLDVFACRERQGRAFRVDRCVADFCSTTPPSVNRCYAVFGAHSEDRGDDPGNHLVRVNLCTGRHTRVEAPPGTPRAIRISSALVATNGDLAWIWEVLHRESPDVARLTYQVVQQVGTKQTVLDQSNAIDPTSLALAGRRLYWTSGGAAATAILG